MSGLISVLNAIHSPKCALSKNAQRVAVNIAWHMGRKYEAWPGLGALVAESHLGRSAVMLAVTELCGPRGLFTRTKRGPGRASLYRLKTAGNPDVMRLKTSGNPDVQTAGKLDIKGAAKTSGNPYAEQISTSTDRSVQIRRIESIQDRMRKIA